MKLLKSMLVIICLLLHFNLLAQTPPITIHVEEAGTLPTLVPENEKYEITDLILTGNLNGTDIRFIREMAGNDFMGRTTNGKLTNLDLSGVNIVNGGNNYYNQFYTIANQISPSMFFACGALKTIILPNSVTTIGWRAFDRCTGLTGITIPNSVTVIENNVFMGCSGLTNVTIPESVTSIGQSAFLGCRGLTSITIPNSIAVIEDFTFYGCTSLPSIIIPNSVTVIKEGAFSECTGLTSITIPNSVTSIGNSAFRFCAGLTSVTIGSGVTTIGRDAFGDCTSLTSVTIGNGVISIGDYAFYNCTSLPSITIPNSVTEIGMLAFYSCTSLTSITIGSGVTSIGESAFYACTSLTSIIIPNNVTEIGNRAFFNCTGLKEFIVSEENSHYSSLEGVLFNKDKTTLFLYPISKSGVSYSIPNSVTAIGGSAFYGCIGLTSVSIGNSVTSIGNWAFWGCIGLTAIYSKNPTPPILESTFGASCFDNSIIGFCKLYVPKGSKRAYQSAPQWRDFINIIEEDVSINTINTDNISIQSVSNAIIIEAKETTPVSVYTLFGQRVYQSVIIGNVEINLNKGVYIVRINNESQKVIVK